MHDWDEPNEQDAAPYQKRYAGVVVQVDAPQLTQPLTYSVPDGMRLAIGDAVLVPFGASREVTGYVVENEIACAPDLAPRVKDILRRIDGAAAFDAGLWTVARWVCEQTLCEPRDGLRLIAPDLTTAHVKTRAHLCPDWELCARTTRAANQKEVLERLAHAPDLSQDVSALIKGIADGAKALAALKRKGTLTVTSAVVPTQTRPKIVRLLRLSVAAEIADAEADRLEARAPKQATLLRKLMLLGTDKSNVPLQGVAIDATDSAAAQALAQKGLAEYQEVAMRRDPFSVRSLTPSTAPALTDEQANACRVIGSAIADPAPRPILLFGVTGSGKTEIYLDAIARARRLRRGALFLLPEIGLTTQVLDLLKARFGDEIAVLHSALSAGERFDEWQRIRRGDAPIVVGARSAVFAPVPNLGLMICDEEHESSYKQDSTPRYHARDAAIFRARQTGAAVVLGSATPSLTSFYKAKIGTYQLVTLTKRVAERPLPPVNLIDLRAKPYAPLPKPSESDRNASQTAPLTGVLSEPLLAALAARLKKHEQAILFLNRRGFSPFLLCRDCGFTFRCAQCDVTLTYHRSMRRLQCHHCDFRRIAPDDCPKCQSLRLRPFGLGTEKVEEAVREAFPEARTLRMDRDTTSTKGAHAQILRAFRRGEADILIGTQMIAKGLDFPNVTLVGVVSADTALNLPDYHASERVFQLLTQVSGRAGRGKRLGEVLIQTFDPEHDSIQFAMRHDYLGFYYWEIAHRRDLNYPPFGVLANVISSDEDERAAITRIEAFARVLRAEIGSLSEEAGTAQILGPVACPLGRLRNRYRWHLLLRCEEKPALLSVLKTALAQTALTDRFNLTVDIDPLTML